MPSNMFHAADAQGRTLAVIDVTHPDFAIDVATAALESLCDQFILESAPRRDVPSALRDALQRSMLGRGLMAASGTYLSGLNTYLLKLGPHNLGETATPIDLSIAASFPAFVTRLRLQDMARLLADGTMRVLAQTSRRCLIFVNIAGGAAADIWNALMYLQTEQPGLLDGRPIKITVLDLDREGPAFGAAALAALRVPDGPLATIDLAYRHVEYNWSVPGQLRECLRDLCESDAACAVSSEGGLFEYGSDAEIVANLQHLHTETANDAFVVGSVTRDGEATRASRTGPGATTRPRTLEQFQALCDRAAWRLDRVIERPFSYNVRLVKD
jgi:hypothetical protein